MYSNKGLGDRKLTIKEFRQIFKIKNLPTSSIRPVAIIMGSGMSGLVNSVSNQKKFRVDTIHGKAMLISGKLKGVPVIVVVRHSKPTSNNLDHKLLPRWINQPAYAVAIAAIDPVAIITMHAVGGTRASSKKSMGLGTIVIIDDFLPNYVNLKTIYTSTIINGISKRGFSVARISHARLANNFLANPSLVEMAVKCAKQVKTPLRKNGVCYSIPGPSLETLFQSKTLIKQGVSTFSMTHQNEVIAIQEALQAMGKRTPCISFGFITDHVPDLGKKISEKDKKILKTASSLRNKFLITFLIEMDTQLSAHTKLQSPPV